MMGAVAAALRPNRLNEQTPRGRQIGNMWLICRLICERVNKNERCLCERFVTCFANHTARSALNYPKLHARLTFQPCGATVAMQTPEGKKTTKRQPKPKIVEKPLVCHVVSSGKHQAAETTKKFSVDKKGKGIFFSSLLNQ